MPKKHTNNLKKHQGPSSVQRNHAVGLRNGTPAPTTVNERLLELRSLPSAESETKKRELADAATRPSVPPELGSILGLAETAPPRARNGARARERFRTPGPAPPRSWTARIFEASSSGKWQLARLKSNRHSTNDGRTRAEQPLAFPYDTGCATHIDEKSLTHIVLKTIAQAWHLFDEQDYDGLSEIPLRLRVRLISYLGYYGPTISVTALDALTRGADDITCLDLTALAGHGSLSVKRITRLISGNNRGGSHIHALQPISDSWETSDATRIEANTISDEDRFARLTHLSLALPPPAVAWRDLLILLQHTPQLTHLSLAHWPRPTLTPNLTTSVVTSRIGSDVHAGGSHYYSGIEQDLVEPANILRQVSASTLCLRWLDLNGCPEWMPALAAAPVHSTTTAAQASNETWSAAMSHPAATITRNWANLTYIRCSQTWLPSYVGLWAGHHAADTALSDAIAKHVLIKDLSPTTTDVFDTEKRRASMWYEAEAAMLAAAKKINRTRRENSLRPITFDFGWRKCIP